MKRILVLAMLVATLAFPAVALGFHHTLVPATACHAAAAGSPSNDNGMVKEALLANFERTGGTTPSLPLPPVGTPGNGQGDGGEHCANAPAD